MWQQFKEFATRGNALDLAVGVIISAAFTPIVATLVDNVIMPVIGYITAGIDFSNLAVTPIEGVEIKYGLFLNAVVQFFLTARFRRASIAGEEELGADVQQEERRRGVQSRKGLRPHSDVAAPGAIELLQPQRLERTVAGEPQPMLRSRCHEDVKELGSAVDRPPPGTRW